METTVSASCGNLGPTFELLGRLDHRRNDRGSGADAGPSLGEIRIGKKRIGFQRLRF